MPSMTPMVIENELFTLLEYCSTIFSDFIKSKIKINNETRIIICKDKYADS